MVEDGVDRLSEYVHFSDIWRSPKEVKKNVDDMVFLIEKSGVEIDFILGHHQITTEEDRYEAENTVSLARLIGSKIKKPYGVIYEDESLPPSYTGSKPFGRVVILDGAVLTGNSIIRIADYLKAKEGVLPVQDAFVLMPRLAGESLKKLEEKLGEKGIKLHYAKTAQQLIEEAHDRGEIPDERFDEAMQDPDFR